MAQYYCKNRLVKILALLLWSWSGLVYGQGIEQLEAQLRAVKGDSSKAVILSSLAANALSQGKIDESIVYANQSMDLSKNTSDLKLLRILGQAYQTQKQYATALNFYLQAQQELQKQDKKQELATINGQIGQLYKDWGIPEKAVEYLKSALNNWKQVGEQEKVVDLLSDLVVSYQGLGEFKQALSYNEELLAYYEQSEQPKRVINALSNISSLRIQLGEPEEALKVQERILMLDQQSKDTIGISSAYNNIGFLHKRLQNLEKSLESFQQSLKYAKEPNPVTLVNIGVIHQVLGSLEPSLLAFFEAAKIREKEQNAIEVARVCNYISAVYQNLEDSENALRYTERAVVFGEKLGSKETLATSYKALSDIYVSLGRNKRALAHYKQYAAIQNALQEEEKAQLQNALQRQVEAEKKENDLKLLLVDKEINQLSVRKLQLESEKKEQQYQLQLQNQELANADLKQKELEKERYLQELTLEKGRIEAEKKDDEIAILQKADSLQKLTLRQKDLEEQERLKDIEILKQREALQKLQAKEEQAKADRERQKLMIGIGITGLILLLILIGFILQRRANAKLRMQQEMLNKQNLKLQEQADEITLQTEELLQQRDEIMAQRDYIEDKNKELESQKNTIQKSYDNIQVLSDIGQQITSTLNLSEIVHTVYESVNRLMVATSFGVGIYNEKLDGLEFTDFIEKDEVLPYSIDYLKDATLPSIQCFVSQKDIVINNLKEAYNIFSVSTEDNRGEIPASLIYMPLQVAERTIGVITVQSFEENAYTDTEITILRSLASYASIALANSHSYDELMAVNEIIKEKNQQITDSLRYARTIEESILPTKTWFNEHFEDYFVLYRPKDIVSGDFYWGHTADGYTILAAVDCTGHGVPGAFMSMIGNAILNRIIRENKEYDPATILDQLNTGIKQVLNQQEHETSEGMDVCLCRIAYSDGKGVEVVFAGAKRPIYYMVGDELGELKGDRLSIGWPYKRTDVADLMFTNQTMMLPHGAQLYFTTDGFVDNPSSERSKIGTPLLKKKLVANASKPMKDQCQAFVDVLEASLEQREQRDDITLIGVKLK